MFHAWGRQEAVERGERQREERQVLILNLGKARQRHRVERHQRPAQQPRERTAGPLPDHHACRPTGEHQADHQHQVVGEHRRGAGPEEGRTDDALHDDVVGVCQRVAFGVERVRLEQAERIRRKGVRVPRQNPLVVNGVVGVVPRQPARVRGQRPRVHEGEEHEEGKGRKRRQAARLVGHRDCPFAFAGIALALRRRRRHATRATGPMMSSSHAAAYAFTLSASGRSRRRSTGGNRSTPE